MSDGSYATEAVVLGVAQDGGVPHAGCGCQRCAAALADPTRRRLPACLGLIDGDSDAHWLIDATPAFPEQWGRLRARAPTARLSGVLLTHAHMGHYTGLVHLGPEAAAASDVPVYASPAVCAFLRAHAPWCDLETAGHVRYVPVAAGDRLELSPSLAGWPITVPHRATHGDTVAWLVEGPRGTLFYCPDTDAWSAWDPALPDLLAARGVTVALLDGTFYDATDLPHRALDEVPHPLATDTARLVGQSTRPSGVGEPCTVRLVHLNHTNRLLDGPVAGMGLAAAQEGEAFDL